MQVVSLLGEESLDITIGILKQGSKGPQVKAWQNMLNRVKGNIRLPGPLAEDGQFGPATKTATIALQKYVGVAADGVVGPKTLQGYRNKFPMIATNVILPKASAPYTPGPAYAAPTAPVKSPSVASAAVNRPPIIPITPEAPPQKAKPNYLLYGAGTLAVILFLNKLKKG